MGQWNKRPWTCVYKYFCAYHCTANETATAYFLLLYNVKHSGVLELGTKLEKLLCVRQWLNSFSECNTLAPAKRHAWQQAPQTANLWSTDPRQWHGHPIAMETGSWRGVQRYHSYRTIIEGKKGGKNKKCKQQEQLQGWTSRSLQRQKTGQLRGTNSPMYYFFPCFLLLLTLSMNCLCCVSDPQQHTAVIRHHILSESSGLEADTSLLRLLLWLISLTILFGSRPIILHTFCLKIYIFLFFVFVLTKAFIRANSCLCSCLNSCLWPLGLTNLVIQLFLKKTLFKWYFDYYKYLYDIITVMLFVHIKVIEAVNAKQNAMRYVGSLALNLVTRLSIALTMLKWFHMCQVDCCWRGQRMWFNLGRQPLPYHSD